MSVNKVILLGRLGEDPKEFNGGCSFSLATSESWTDKQGQKQERTEWHTIKAFRRTGELAAKHLTKGRQVYIEGKVAYDSYDKDDGTKVYTTSIVANSVQFLGDRPSKGRDDHYPETKASF